MPSPLSRVEVGLGDLGHVGSILNNFGSSLGSRNPWKTQINFQREISTSAMLLFEVAFFHLVWSYFHLQTR